MTFGWFQAEPLVIPPGCPNVDSAKTKEFFHLCRQALLTVGIIRDAVGGKRSRDANYTESKDSRVC
jgi:hypothetical protein